MHLIFDILIHLQMTLLLIGLMSRSRSLLRSKVIEKVKISNLNNFETIGDRHFIFGIHMVCGKIHLMNSVISRSQSRSKVTRKVKFKNLNNFKTI